MPTDCDRSVSTKMSKSDTPPNRAALPPPINTVDIYDNADDQIGIGQIARIAQTELSSFARQQQQQQQ